MNVVDSSGWVAFFTGGANAAAFRDIITDTRSLIVPTVCVAEVYRWCIREVERDDAQAAVAVMLKAAVIHDLDTETAMLAATRGLEFRLPLADSVIYATAELFKATLWTQDADFDGLPNVRYLARWKP